MKRKHLPLIVLFLASTVLSGCQENDRPASVSGNNSDVLTTFSGKPVVTTVVTSFTETSVGFDAGIPGKSLETTTDLPEPTNTAEVPSVDNIRLSIDHDGTEITKETKSITLKAEYTGSDESAAFFTGAEYRIEKFTDGAWSIVPFSDGMTWIALAYEISYRSNAVIGIGLSDDNFAEPLTAGKYRVAKSINGVEFYAEFEIVQERVRF
ncbi:MAG: hypothetical protein IK093_18630 [Ruminiclostridium sp.]|nr:hypothetical protein [Ruminiclostridium sp.]